MKTKPQCVLIHIRIKGEIDTMKLVLASSNFLTDCFKGVFILWIVFVIRLCHTAISVS